jgi:surface antigen
MKCVLTKACKTLNKSRRKTVNCRKQHAILTAVALFTIASVLAPVTAQAEDHGHGIAWEFSKGELTVYVAGARLSEILEVRVGDQVLDDRMLQSGVELKDGSVAIPVGTLWSRSAAPLDVKVRFTDDSTISLPIDLVTSAATSCTAPFKYNAKQCGASTTTTAPVYPCCDNNNNGVWTDSSDGNCTWYAAMKAKAVKGWVVPSWGNANTWCSNARNNSKWVVSSTPSVDSIACVQRIGHVAWVTSVSTDQKTVTVSEQNCSTWSTILNRCFYSGTRSSTYNRVNDQVSFIRCATSTGCK